MKKEFLYTVRMLTLVFIKITGNLMRRLALFIVASLCYLYVYSSNKSPIGLSVEVSSKYMWRGIEYGTAPTIFPMISFNKAGFSVFGMGAYAFNGSHQEVDLGVSYSYKGFTLGISDYYYPSAVGENDKYFNFNNKTTNHSVEAYLNVMPFRFPLWMTVSTYIFGNDKRLDGRQAYSSYIELGYNHNFNEKNILSIAAGANMNKSFYTSYKGKANVVNVALKYTYNIQIKTFTLPLSASYIINPYREKSFFTFSASFSL